MTNLLWDMNGFHHFCADHLFFTKHNVLDKIYRDIVVRWQINRAIGRQKIVDFSFALILSREFLRGYFGILLEITINSLHLLIILIHLQEILYNFQFNRSCLTNSLMINANSKKISIKTLI